MKQFNDITIIGIDQGYGNMKTANTIFSHSHYRLRYRTYV